MRQFLVAGVWERDVVVKKETAAIATLKTVKGKNGRRWTFEGILF
jgi:hypothetical protein